MTNYDRWKLATPDYLEDKDEGEPVHDTDVDGEDGDDASSGGKIYANPFIKLNHIGTYVYSGDIIKSGGNMK